MKKLLIFGTGPEAERVLREAERDGRREVAAFVSEAPAAGSVLFGRPVHDRAHALEHYPRDQFEIFACGGKALLNQERLAAYMQAKRSGFRVASIVSAAALVPPELKLRENIFIDAGARVMEGANIGANAWILGGACIGYGAQLGHSCWIAEGCEVMRGAVLGKNCTLEARAVAGENVKLPAWTLLNRPVRIDASRAHAVFLDPLFREEVVLRGAPGK